MSNTLAIAVSLVVLSLIALALSIMVLRRYLQKRRACHLYWGVGLVLVFVTVLEEVPLSVGVFSQPLILSYLVLVAVLVGVLSLGSAELALSGRWKTLWFGYIGVVSAALTGVSVVTPVSSSIVVNGVVTGLPPFWIEILSILVTVPAALFLIVASLYGAVRGHRWNLLYIAAGTAVISAAGALYIASFPVTLYYAEFVGVVLLFFGFVKVPGISSPAAQPQSA
jgi:hypothetical protein